MKKDLGQEPVLLLAENAKQMLKSQLAVLRDLGYKRVITARTGTEALDILKAKPVDLVLSSWSMPEMTGIALLKVTRFDASLRELPFVLMAGSVTKGQVIEAGEAGVTDIVCLPLSPPTLRGKLKRALLSSQDPQHVEAEEHYQSGLKLMEKGRYDEALESFKRVLGVYENAEVYYNMGYISTARGEYESAIRFFRKATEINHAFARAYQKMGEAYLKLGREKAAQKAYQDAADIYLEKHMDDDAEAALQEVLKINPNTINVFNSLGIIYRRQGRYDKALVQYQKAMKVNPDDENILYNLGRAHYDMEQFEEAAEVLEKALKMNPDFKEAAGLIRNIQLRGK